MLLSWPRPGAAGTWSVLSLPQRPGDVYLATAMATDDADNLHVADEENRRVQMNTPDP
jgi:hypothetical protein